MPSSMLHSTWVAQIDGWPRHIGWHRRRQTSVCAAQDCSRFIRLCDRTESDHRVDEILWLRQPDIVPMSGPPKFLWPDATEVWVARQERSDGRGLPVLPSAFFGPKCQRGEVLELYFARGSLNSPRPSLARARSGSCHPVEWQVLPPGFFSLMRRRQAESLLFTSWYSPVQRGPCRSTSGTDVLSRRRKKKTSPR